MVEMKSRSSLLPMQLDPSKSLVILHLVYGSFHGLILSSTNLAQQIQFGIESISMKVGTTERTYKLRQPGPTNRGADRPYAPGRVGPDFMLAPRALPDICDPDPASVTILLK